MFKKILLSTLVAIGFASNVFALTDVYVQEKNIDIKPVDYKFTYNNVSALEFLTTRFYCGAIYLFGRTICYEHPTSTPALVAISPKVENNTYLGTSTGAAGSVTPSYNLPSTSAPQQIVYTSPQRTIYQVIEKVIERAVPGPKGDEGDKGDSGLAGSAGSAVSAGSGNYYSSYVAGAQYNGSTNPNSSFTTINTNTINSNAANSDNITTHNLTATGTTNLATTTINGSLTLNPVNQGSATSSILVYGPNGEVQQVSAGDILASNTTNTINYTGGASNTLSSTVNGVVSTSSIDTLNSIDLTGTTTADSIITDFIQPALAYITNLLFDNATGTNITATGTANLANLITSNATITDLVGGNATFTTLAIPASSVDNGLSVGADAKVELGGILHKATNIDQAGYDLTIANGSVGIGTTTPSYTLDVSGELNQTATLGSGRTTNIQSHDNILGLGLQGIGMTTQSSAGVLGYMFTGESPFGYSNQSVVGLTDFGSKSAEIGVSEDSLGNLKGDFGVNSPNGSSWWNLEDTGNSEFISNNNSYGTYASNEIALSTNAPHQRWYLSDGTASNNMTLTPQTFQVNSYPQTRDDSATVAPLNFLYTDTNGVFQSAALSAIPSNLKYYKEDTTAPNASPSVVTGTQSVAIGDSSTVSGSRSYNLGAGNNINGNNSYTVGEATTVDGARSYSVGIQNAVLKDDSYTLGANNSIDAAYSLALGAANILTGDSNYVLGYTNTQAGNETFVIGNNNVSDIANNEYIIGVNNKSIVGGTKDNYIIGESNNLSNFSGSHFINLGSYFNSPGTGSGSIDRLAVVGFDNNSLNSIYDSSIFGNNNTVDGTTDSYILGAHITNNVSGTVDIGTQDSTKATIDQAGRLTLRGALNVTGSDGTTGQILTSQGAGVMPVWASPAAILASSTTNVLAFATSTGVLTSTVNGVPATTTLLGMLCENTLLGTFSFCNGGNTSGANAVLGTNDNFNLGFETNNVEKMTLFSLANPSIGIGRTSLTGVNGGASSYSGPTLFTGAAGNFSGSTGWDFIMDDDNNATNNQIRFRANGDGAAGTLDIMTVDEVSGGRVGIGTTAPGNKLEITSATASTSGLRFTNLTSLVSPATGTTKFLTVDQNGDVVLATSTQNSFSTLTVGTTTLAAGKVATFAGDIDVTGTIDPTRILFTNLAGVDSPSYNPSANSNNYKIEFAEGGNLIFASASTSNIMRMMNDGKVGIGTNPTAGYVQITPNVATSALYISGIYNAPLLHLNTTAAAANSILITDSSASNNGAIELTRTTGNFLSNSINAGINITGNYQHYGGNGLGTGARINVTNNTATAGYTLYGANIDATANTAGNTVVGIRSNVSSSAGKAYAGIFTGGNVGVGTTAPGNALHIASSSGSVSGLRLGITSSTATTTSSGKVLGINTSGDVILVEDAAANGNVNCTNSKTVYCQGGNSFGAAGVLGTNDSNPLLLRTNGTERVRITATGNIGIGATAPNYRLTNTNAVGIANQAGVGMGGNEVFVWQKTDAVTGYTAAINNTTTGTSMNGLLVKTTDTTANSKILTLNSNGTDRLTVEGGGNVGIGTNAPTAVLSVNGNANNTTGVWGIFSDARLKNVESDFTDGLDTILKFAPKRFKYNGKEGITDTTSTQVGIVAQDVQQFAPYMVSTVKGQEYDDVRQFSSQALPYMLINAVKELNTKITTATNTNLTVVSVQEMLTAQNSGAIEVGATSTATQTVLTMADGSQKLADSFTHFVRLAIEKLNNYYLAINLWIDKLTTNQVCFKDATGETCLDKAKVDELLLKNAVSATAPVPTTLVQAPAPATTTDPIVSTSTDPVVAPAPATTTAPVVEPTPATTTDVVTTPTPEPAQSQSTTTPAQ